jgi:uncharacterized protein YdhG (YjbR/CyaY superfamily)
MTGNQLKSVDDYIGGQPESARGALELVRAAIRNAIPASDETISYNIPTYRLRGRVVIYFAAWKKHLSLYPASAKLIEIFKKDLAAAMINKSTIRFPLAEPVPVKLIGRIAKFRVKEQAERAKAKKSRSVQRAPLA